MNKTKRVLASVMAIALVVISVGYFSTMSQTSAWFYDSGVIDSGDHFWFADLSVDTAFVIESSIGFDGATKLADKNEILFDEAIYIDTIKVVNSGNISSKVTVQVDNKTDAKGLRWFVYSEDMTAKGSIKSMIAAELPKLDKKSLDNYNNAKYFVVEPGDTQTIKVAFWVEYDDVCDKLSSGEALEYYNAEITLSSSHYREQA